MLINYRIQNRCHFIASLCADLVVTHRTRTEQQNEQNFDDNLTSAFMQERSTQETMFDMEYLSKNMMRV